MVLFPFGLHLLFLLLVLSLFDIFFFFFLVSIHNKLLLNTFDLNVVRLYRQINAFIHISNNEISNNNKKKKKQKITVNSSSVWTEQKNGIIVWCTVYSVQTDRNSSWLFLCCSSRMCVHCKCCTWWLTVICFLYLIHICHIKIFFHHLSIKIWMVGHGVVRFLIFFLFSILLLKHFKRARTRLNILK